MGFWDKEAEIGRVTTDSGEITVLAVEKNRRQFVDIRKWYVDRKTDELKPGKGISIPVEEFEEVLGHLNSLTDQKAETIYELLKEVK